MVGRLPVESHCRDRDLASSFVLVLAIEEIEEHWQHPPHLLRSEIEDDNEHEHEHDEERG
jgi:hypothetical protein